MMNYPVFLCAPLWFKDFLNHRCHREHTVNHLLYSRGSGSGSRPRPAKTSLNSCSSASCISPFEAIVSRLLSSKGEPSKRLTCPPASSTIRTPAAVSHGFRLNSQKPSNRPAATQHKSSAADPARLTP